MTRAWAIRLLTLCATIGLAMTAATADAAPSTFTARLSGFNETPPILTAGHGSFHATVQGDAISYTETFSDLSAPVTQSHIHFAQRGVAGSIVVFLCSNLGNGPAGTQACPAGGGTISGRITAANVLSVPGQNVKAMDFAGLLRFIRAGDGYVNVHTSNATPTTPATCCPAGEIRGQITFGED
jgi:hypothetical protein